MKISGLEIDGFGVWSGLKLEGLSEGINVLYGPNEAGKTTLLQFVRSVLYGFSPERQRYFPPVRGGRPGGAIDVAGPNGSFHLDRHLDADADASGAEQLVLSAADGTRQGEHLVKVLLSQIDEKVFNNVFAVGLREIQHLGTLSDTEAAEKLYSLTAGLDRVSLVEVMRELETSRNRLLQSDGGPCQVAELLSQREQLQQKIEGLAESTRHYGRLADEQKRIRRDITRMEEESTAAERQARVIELAVALRESWQQREAFSAELAALGPSATVPEGAIERLDALNVRLGKHQERLDRLQRLREQLRRESAELGINEALSRQTARIEAIQEQEPWIANLQDQAGKLAAEIAQLESRLAGECKSLGLDEGIEPGAVPKVSNHTISLLRPPAKALRRHRQELAEAKKEAAAANETAELLSRQIESALVACPSRLHATGATATGATATGATATGATAGLPSSAEHTVGQANRGTLAEAIDRAGERVSQLRRRLQLDERLDEMTRYQNELEDQSRRLVDRPLLPVGVLIALGCVFVLGVVLVMVGLFMPASITGSLGWAMALLGLAGTGVAAGLKITLERSNARQLETCRKQIGMLQSQIETAKEERASLDKQLPPGGGPIVSRLDTAEKDLAALEEFVPLDTRRTAARQESESARRRAAQAEHDLSAARRRWREALTAARLPGNLVPKQVRKLLQSCDQIGELQRRLGHRREELGQRRRELDSLRKRIQQLIADAGVPVTSDQPIEQLVELSEAVSRQESRVARRDVLRRQARQIRRRRVKHEEATSRLEHQRRDLFRESSVGGEQELRQRAVEAARAGVLRQQHDAVAREIATAIGRDCSEEAVARQLQAGTPETLETQWDQLSERVERLKEQLKVRFEERGQLAEQMKTLADDRELAHRQLDLSALDARLDDAVRRWQVLAVTSRILETIRTVYEKERQPETLQEASGYLDRLTEGRYRRVWTPLGEDVLKVDDADGNSLPVESLSRGTREQLFLGLRLALAAAYARHGAPLPLVLDDVLVNFDARRAKAAAAVLRDFAAEGHQLLVFTCHEHILRLFKSLKVPVNHLPNNTEDQPAPVTFAEPAAKRQTRKMKKPKPPVELIEEQAEEPVEDEVIEDEIIADEPVEAGVFEPPEEEPWDEEEGDEADEEEEYEEEDYDEEEGDEEDDTEDEFEWEEADEWEEEDDEYDDDAAEAA